MPRAWPRLPVSFAPPARSWAVAALALALTGCPAERSAQPPADAPATSEAKSGVSAVYPPTPSELPPGVRALCDALHAEPSRRKAACCSANEGVVLTGECVRNLAGAIGQGGLTLDAARVKTCTTALERSYEGCEWVGPHMPAVPEACVSALEGRRDEGEVCRSTLECKAGLRCAGGSPTDAGRCRPPAPAGKVCNTGVDALAPYLRIDVATLRPGCGDGFCDKNVCRASIGAGGECQSSVQCGAGLRCAGGRCIDGALGAEGEPCSGGDCAADLRCVGQACMAPRAAGAPCIQHAQCKAGCVQNVCKQVCSAAELLRALPAANAPPKPVMKPGFKPRVPPLKTPEPSH